MNGNIMEKKAGIKWKNKDNMEKQARGYNNNMNRESLEKRANTAVKSGQLLGLEQQEYYHKSVKTTSCSGNPKPNNNRILRKSGKEITNNK